MTPATDTQDAARGEARFRQKHGVTAEQFSASMGVIVKATARFLKEMFTERDVRLEDLDRRLRSLEAEPRVKDAGVWQVQKSYYAGDLITWKGSGWICTRPHISGEAFDYSGFRLVIKGRDRER